MNARKASGWFLVALGVAGWPIQMYFYIRWLDGWTLLLVAALLTLFSVAMVVEGRSRLKRPQSASGAAPDRRTP